MQRIVIHRPGGYDRLCLEPAPSRSPGPGEVRIAVSHSGINYADCIVRMGLYESAKRLVGWPITPGFEVAGQIAETGPGITSFAAGDPVLALTLFDGYSGSLTLPADQVLSRPESLSAAQAAAVPTVYLTAWFALHELGQLRAGARVLIHSAAGGVGCAAIQLARQAGAKVTAVVGGPHKVAIARKLGATTVIDKSSQTLWPAARASAPQGYDLILDPNGAQTLAASYAALAPLGRLVVYGFHTMLPRSHDGSSGRPNWLRLLREWLRTPRFNPLHLTVDNRSVMGFNLSFLSQRSDLLLPAMRQILHGLTAGQLQVPPLCIYPLAEVARAHRELESGLTVGKLVLAH